MSKIPFTQFALTAGLMLASTGAAFGQIHCEDVEMKNDSAKDGDNGFVCPCFAEDEIVMSVINVPDGYDAHELLEAHILWDSLLGGPDVTVERELIIYDMNQTGDVNPASLSIIASFEDPELHKGFLNKFDLRPYGLIMPERRFGIGVKFATDKRVGGGLNQPTIVEDADGHNNWDNTTRNWVYAIPGGWLRAQDLGTSGDWIIRALVNSCTFGPSFRLAEPQPGIAGTVNTFSVTGAEPGAKVYFAYSLRTGSTQVPGCSGLILELKKPTVMGSLIANANGDVELNMQIPQAAAGITAHFQAVQLQPTCTATTRVTYEFK